MNYFFYSMFGNYERSTTIHLSLLKVDQNDRFFVCGLHHSVMVENLVEPIAGNHSFYPERVAVYSVSTSQEEQVTFRFEVSSIYYVESAW